MQKTPNFVNNTDIGQNFLIDRSVIDYIIKKADIQPEDQILEIGPGEGILTEALLASPCRSVCAVELDTRLKPNLEAIALKNPKFSLLWGDAVQLDYANKLPWLPNRIIANLPYHITTPLLWTLIEKLVPKGLSSFILMVQLESAQRITSPERNKQRSPLGVTIEAMGSSKILRSVPPSCFRPQPRVMSCLIEITIDKSREFATDKKWKQFLVRSFAQRRKTLTNNWAAGYGLSKERSQQILEAHGLKPLARAEELPLEKWKELFEAEDFKLTK
ncbi:MAG: ribosomal RNA small subunit methyltransferase A [Synergistaceae bacterium]|nr:ribosomal RNA small subunit methyltransferase A [Candidatus Equadaptatus faecalis]